MKSSFQERADQVITQTYGRYPLTITRGAGCTLWDENNREYTDFIAGIAVCNLGHSHPDLVKVMLAQAETLWHVSNLFYTQPQVDLASWLVARSFADRAFFCNSGAEANEAAIKLVRKYFQDQSQSARFQIIAMEKSFHGRTMASLSATGQDKIKTGFNPLLPGFKFVPYNDFKALENTLDDSVCAVMLEPIQGEGGIQCPHDNYLKNIRRLCDERGALLIFDEVQTGIGRTGRLFAHEHFGVVPDIMTLAKALGNGLPIGAMLTTEKVAAAFGPGAHASTFGGTPLVSAVALSVLKTIEKHEILKQCTDTGKYFKDRLKELQKKYDTIVDVRGYGLMLGMELNKPGDSIVTALLEKGFLVNCIQDTILRLAPPLIIERSQIDALIVCMEQIFREVD